MAGGAHLFVAVPGELELTVALHRIAGGRCKPGAQFVENRAIRLLAQLYLPDEAVDAGFVDQVVGQGDLLATSIREAEKLAALDPEAYAATIRTTRGQAIARLEALIEEDFGSSQDSL